MHCFGTLGVEIVENCLAPASQRDLRLQIAEFLHRTKPERRALRCRCVSLTVVS